jgi:hypothetical protein
MLGAKIGTTLIVLQRLGALDLNILRGEVMLDALDAQEAGNAEERRRRATVAESGRYQGNTWFISNSAIPPYTATSSER